MIIGCIRVEDSEAEDGTARAFLSIQAGRGMAYHTLNAVKASRELQLAVLRQGGRVGGYKVGKPHPPAHPKLTEGPLPFRPQPRCPQRECSG